MWQSSLCASCLLLGSPHGWPPRLQEQQRCVLHLQTLTWASLLTPLQRQKTFQLLVRTVENLVPRTLGLKYRGKHRGKKIVKSCPKQSGRVGIICRADRKRM